MRLRGLDTNVLLRWLTHDDPDHLRIVDAVLQQAEKRGETLWISTPVLCEVVWTLASRYRAKRPEIVRFLHMLLDTALFEIQQRDVVRLALDDYASGQGGFPDYLIGRSGEAAGCETTLTLDRALRDSALFDVLA